MARKGTKLNLLPENPQKKEPFKAVGPGRFPPWLHRKLPSGNTLFKTRQILNTHHIPTVCEEAKCPNLLTCWSQKTATFLAMGKECTRSCGFCSIDFAKQPKPLDKEEPTRLAESVKLLGLKHVVITMVARDDLPDGGAAHLSEIIQEIRRQNSGITVEVLTSDFAGNENALQTIIEAKPEIFNHNIETVRSRSPRVRHRATYDRTLSVLRYVAAHTQDIFIKSGLMVGLGETHQEVKETINDLHKAGCQIITIGQYLQSSQHKLLVKAFITPQQFEEYAAWGSSIDVLHMYCGPFVRSSFNAASLFNSLSEKQYQYSVKKVS